MKITYIGYNIELLYQECQNGNFSSSLLYGAVQLKKKGITVSFYSLSKNGLFGMIKDIMNLQKEKSDFLFFPYLGGRFFFLILIAKIFGLIRKEKLVGILHITPTISISNIFYIKYIYKIFDKVYFHSPKNMQECIQKGIVYKEKSELLLWGSDLSYIDSVINDTIIECKSFISTGLENRDFSTLIKAFSYNKDNSLDIYMHDSSILNIPKSENVKIHYIPLNKSNQYFTIIQAHNSQCVVIPINNEGLSYCTGHTSIVEAMALGKPIIVTENSYHPIDVEKEKIGLKVKPYDVDSWTKAIKYISSHPNEINQMGKNGRALAESCYNINKCAEQIYSYIIK